MKEKYKNLAKNHWFIRAVFSQILLRKHSCLEENAIRENMEKFMSKDELDNKRYFQKIYKDLLELKYIDDVTYFDEYFLFDFPNKTKKERKTYVGTDEYLRYATKKIKTKEVEENPILKDKYQAYLTLKEYYKRDIAPIRDMTDYGEFNEFCQKHSAFLLKKETGSLGKNIIKYDLEKQNISPKNLFLSAMAQGQWVAEEIIKQDESMAEFHPQSVNTVRIATFYDDNEVSILFAMFRTGSGGSVVDNASSGGICASVDVETGIIESLGYKKNGQIVDTQPDTNHIIKGFQIPKWNELISLSKEVAKALPIYKYVGWDFALTPDGWVVVEGNSRPNVNSIQMCSGRGLREKLDATLGLN